MRRYHDGRPTYVIGGHLNISLATEASFIVSNNIYFAITKLNIIVYIAALESLHHYRFT